ncbi:MAG: hypothetical protein A4E64_02492 [Syntrophorhabdus sp. PtaU1.Bin058]|nr:MAG: hypothetical protein A4E64_02492 [Syntrophorhabdus sp. PtaU1.Bin058]
MRKRFCIQRKGFGIFRLVAVLSAIALYFAGPASAIDTELWGKPLSLTGIVKQGVSYGIAGDQYDTKKGVQSLLTQVILEAKYEPNPDVSCFLTGKYNADQAYPVLSDNHEWRNKQFNKSRTQRYLLDDWQDILGEAHITVKKGDFYLRVGKQVVAWGETDGFRLMDQINPLDQRRGITDVEFENSIIPVWLIRAEYRPPTRPEWMQDLNYQFIFNPNPQFRGNQNILPGNDTAGIWAPRSDIPLGGPYPFDYAHLGSLAGTIEQPDNFSPEGFTYAGRITANIWDSRISLNGYYGRSLDFVYRNTPLGPIFATSPLDGRTILSPVVEGYYPYFKYVGATFSRDISFLKASALGGVSPVLRVETLYAFNSTFVDNVNNQFVKHDEFRGAVGMDWKIKVPLLNPKAYFSISPQIANQRIMNYPGSSIGPIVGSSLSEGYMTGLYENNWTSTLMISTSYMHTKLQPSFFWLRDWTNHSEFFRYQLIWEHSSVWKYTLGALVVRYSKDGVGLQPLMDKDHIYFNVACRF